MVYRCYTIDVPSKKLLDLVSKYSLQLFIAVSVNWQCFYEHLLPQFVAFGGMRVPEKDQISLTKSDSQDGIFPLKT